MKGLEEKERNERVEQGKKLDEEEELLQQRKFAEAADNGKHR